VAQFTATPVTPTVTTGIKKSPDALNLSPNATISYTVTLSLASFQPQVRIYDIFSSSDTSQPRPYAFEAGSAQMLGPGFTPAQSLQEPVCTNFGGQTDCIFDFTNLDPGTYILTYRYRLTNMQCFASGHNEVHLQFPPSPINVRTHTVSYLVRCPV
jgi:hypothetical protein